MGSAKRLDQDRVAPTCTGCCRADRGASIAGPERRGKVKIDQLVVGHTGFDCLVRFQVTSDGSTECRGKRQGNFVRKRSTLNNACGTLLQDVVGMHQRVGSKRELGSLRWRGNVLDHHARHGLSSCGSPHRPRCQPDKPSRGHISVAFGINLVRGPTVIGRLWTELRLGAHQIRVPSGDEK